MAAVARDVCAYDDAMARLALPRLALLAPLDRGADLERGGSFCGGADASAAAAYVP